MEHIHWYPGHIAKAEKELKQKLSLVDVVIEVIDSRVPLSSQYPNIEKLMGSMPRLILLNKSDLADYSLLKMFKEKISNDTKCPVLITSATDFKDINTITKNLIDLSKPKIQKLVDKGLLPRPARVMVVGMPNVGKSSIVNKLIKKTKAKTGAKAGVTKQQQWVRVNPKIDLLDTPGIIPYRQDDQTAALKLTFVSSIGENAFENEASARELLKILNDKYKKNLYEYYKFEDEEEISLEAIAIKRKWLLKDNEPDVERTSALVLNDFRTGKIGKFILDDME